MCRKEQEHVTQRVMDMKVERYRSRIRPKKWWLDGVRKNMEERGIMRELTSRPDQARMATKTFIADLT